MTLPMDYAVADAGYEMARSFSDLGLPAISAALLAVLVAMAFRASMSSGDPKEAIWSAVAAMEAIALWIALQLADIDAYYWYQSFGIAFLAAFALMAPGIVLLLSTRSGRSGILRLGSFLVSSRLGGTAAFLMSFCFFTAVAIRAEFACWDFLILAFDVFGEHVSSYWSLLAFATAAGCLLAALGALAPVGFARSDEARALSCVLSAACGVGAGFVAVVVWRIGEQAAYQHLGGGVWVYAAAVLAVVFTALVASLASWALSKRRG